jgi:hypothetical protein
VIQLQQIGRIDFKAICCVSKALCGMAGLSTNNPLTRQQRRKGAVDVEKTWYPGSD